MASLRATPSPRILPRSAPKNVTGYITSGRWACQVVIPSITALVIERMNSGATSVPYFPVKKD